MPSLTCFRFRFTPSWFMIFVSTLVFSLLLKLGFWQLQRADEKKSMINNAVTQEKQPTMRWDEVKPLPQQYQKIKLSGHFLPHVFLLDNQHHDHQFGYDVLSPLLLANGQVVLIDRGWIVGDNSRLRLPAIETPKTGVDIQGTAYFPSANSWILGPTIEKLNNKMAIIETIDAHSLSQILQKKVYPFIMRLDKQYAYGFLREWRIVSMPPERHLAYALQWFTMALVVLILFIALNLKKNDEKTWV